MGETPRIIIAKFVAKSKEKAAAEIKRGKFKKRLDFYGGYAVYYVSVERRTHISRGGAGVARRAHNPKVEGSNPSPATTMKTQEFRWNSCVFCFLCPDANQRQNSLDASFDAISDAN